MSDEQLILEAALAVVEDAELIDDDNCYGMLVSVSLINNLKSACSESDWRSHINGDL